MQLYLFTFFCVFAPGLFNAPVPVDAFESASGSGSGSVSVSVSESVTGSNVETMDLFAQFRAQHHIQYKTTAELSARYQIFQDNVRFIQAHNIRGRNFTLGITRYADLTAAEFAERHLTRPLPTQASTPSECTSYKKAASYNPEYVYPGETAGLDWRDCGVVNPIKDQGQCGSCWAFAATSVAESAWAIASKTLVVLSEQELVDCTANREYHNLGCNGGNIEYAFAYQLQHGQSLGADYPYVSGETSVRTDCQAERMWAMNDKSASPVVFDACYNVDASDQIALMQAVNVSPVAVAIEADTKYFQLYKSGILTGDACGTELDHAVVIVGYGTDAESGVSYWTVRNSWGGDWGESGYVRIERPTAPTRAPDAGVCGIALSPHFMVSF